MTSSMAGIPATTLRRGPRNAIGAMRTMATLSALTDILVTSLSEPASLVAKTGNPLHGVEAIARTFGQMTSELFKLPKTEQRQVAEWLGLLADDVMGAVNSSRFGSADSAGYLNAAAEHGFFRYTGIDWLTRSQQIASAQIAMNVLDAATKGFQGKKWFMSQERGAYVLSSMGIPAAQHQAFASWWQQANAKDRPSFADWSSPMGRVAQNAVTNWSRQGIQMPDAAARPRWATAHPVLGLAFQLQAFTHALSKNVLIPALKQAGRAFTTGKGAGSITTVRGVADRVAMLMPIAVGIPLMVAGQALVLGLKDWAWGDDDEVDRRTDGWYWEQYFRRTGLFMNVDPIIQGMAATLYGREPLTSLSGPAVGILAELGSSISNAIMRNSENTDAAERRLTRATWDAVGKPALLGALSLMQLPGVVGTALTYAVGNPATRRWITETLGGEAAHTQRPIGPVMPSVFGE
jgi:hypothetical protein